VFFIRIGFKHRCHATQRELGCDVFLPALKKKMSAKLLRHVTDITHRCHATQRELGCDVFTSSLKKEDVSQAPASRDRHQTSNIAVTRPKGSLPVMYLLPALKKKMSAKLLRRVTDIKHQTSLSRDQRELGCDVFTSSLKPSSFRRVTDIFIHLNHQSPPSFSFQAILCETVCA
jgi:hypothetical protein